VDRTGPARLAATLLCAALLISACGGDDAGSDVDRAQAKVEAKQRALDDATKSAEDAAATFCDAGATYLTALDRYGDVLRPTTATVGDVKDAGADLAEPQQDVVEAGDDAVAAREDVVAAEKELADAKAELAAAKGTSPKPTPSSSATALVPEASQPSFQRVRTAAAELGEAVSGISDDTPLVQASQELNAAAVALELSWLRLLADVGCLTDEQQVQAEKAVRDYTTSLQHSLADAGYYEGSVDGIYGPETVAAVEALQRDHDLPVTGTVDTATAAALESELAAQGSVAATEAVASTAALQQTLTLAGYWTGPVDGTWTPELTEALKEFQTDLGVKPTGTVDPATVAALEEAIAGENEPSAEPETESPETESPDTPGTEPPDSPSSQAS
jgi:peptidoglycan hydrolase-like protein with peptidoglycan-binding domain